MNKPGIIMQKRFFVLIEIQLNLMPALMWCAFSLPSAYVTHPCNFHTTCTFTVLGSKVHFPM
jgi:hypothetical protein